MKKPQLLVREVDPELVTALKQRAAASGRSAESEHRQILQEALGGTNRITLAEALLKIPTGIDSSVFERQDENGSANVLD